MSFKSLFLKIFFKEEPAEQSEEDLQISPELPTSEENPYLSARREWNERYGSYIARSRTWQVVALCSMGLSAILALSLVKVATASKVQPFIVEVDKLGEAAAIKRAEPVDFKDSRFEKMIRAEVIRFIENIRSVTTDKAVQKVWVKHAYALVNAPVSEYLNNYFKDPLHDPFSISKVNTVSIEIESVIPSSPETWEVVWTEIKQPSGANGGATLEKTRWKAIVGIAKYEQKSESQIIINPAGFVITSLSWTQQLN